MEDDKAPGAVRDPRSVRSAGLAILLAAFLGVGWWTLSTPRTANDDLEDDRTDGVADTRMAPGLLTSGIEKAALTGSVIQEVSLPASAASAASARTTSKPQSVAAAAFAEQAATPASAPEEKVPCVNGYPIRSYAKRLVPLPMQSSQWGKLRIENWTVSPFFVKVKEVNSNRQLATIFLLPGQAIIEPAMSMYVTMALYSDGDWCDDAKGWERGKKTDVDGIVAMQGGLMKVVLGTSADGVLAVQVGKSAEEISATGPQAAVPGR